MRDSLGGQQFPLSEGSNFNCPGQGDARCQVRWGRDRSARLGIPCLISTGLLARRRASKRGPPIALGSHAGSSPLRDGGGAATTRRPGICLRTDTAVALARSCAQRSARRGAFFPAVAGLVAGGRCALRLQMGSGREAAAEDCVGGADLGRRPSGPDPFAVAQGHIKRIKAKIKRIADNAMSSISACPLVCR